MKDSDFINFQDDFYNLLTKYGVSEYYCMTSSGGKDQDMFNKVCSVRDNLIDFIDKLEKIENENSLKLTDEQLEEETKYRSNPKKYEEDLV